MAVVYDNTTKQARLQGVIDTIDAGVGNGSIEIGDSGFTTVLATIPLAAGVGSATNDVLTFTMPQSDSSADATGTAAEARIKDGDGNIRITGLTVGAGSGDINLDSVSFTAGQQVTINSGTITHAA
jgi:hypothetical protein